MRLNAIMTKRMIVTMSIHNASTVDPITLDQTVLNKSVDLDILGLTFDVKMTFDEHLRFSCFIFFFIFFFA